MRHYFLRSAMACRFHFFRNAAASRSLLNGPEKKALFQRQNENSRGRKFGVLRCSVRA
jgi:hypothetical protein